jgi:hypothetical protein
MWNSFRQVEVLRKVAGYMSEGRKRESLEQVRGFAQRVVRA